MRIILIGLLGLVAAIMPTAAGDKLPELKPALVGITVKELDKSIDWYVNNYGFHLETSTDYPDYKLRIAMLRREGTRLELVEFAGEATDRNPLTPVKIGFAEPDLVKLVKLLKQNGTEIIAGPGPIAANDNLADWPSHYLLTRDPDGTWVQSFSWKEEPRPFAPFLLMLQSPDKEALANWYKSRLGFKELSRVGEGDNERLVMRKDDFVLELMKAEPGDKEVVDKNPGLIKLGFRIDSMLERLEFEKADLFREFTASTQQWANNYLILKDPGNFYIQLFD